MNSIHEFGLTSQHQNTITGYSMIITYLRNHIFKKQNTWFSHSSNPSICLLMMFLSGYYIHPKYAILLGIIFVLLGLHLITLSFSTLSGDSLSKQSRLLNSIMMASGCCIVFLGIVTSVQIFPKPYWISLLSMVLYSSALLACLKVFMNESPIIKTRGVKLGVTISSAVGVYSLGWYTYLLLNEIIYEKTINPPGPQFIPLVFVSGIAFTAWSILIMSKDQKKSLIASMYTILGVLMTGMGIIGILFI